MVPMPRRQKVPPIELIKGRQVIDRAYFNGRFKVHTCRSLCCSQHTHLASRGLACLEHTQRAAYYSIAARCLTAGAASSSSSAESHADALLSLALAAQHPPLSTRQLCACWRMALWMPRTLAFGEDNEEGDPDTTDEDVGYAALPVPHIRVPHRMVLTVNISDGVVCSLFSVRPQRERTAERTQRGR